MMPIGSIVVITLLVVLIVIMIVMLIITIYLKPNLSSSEILSSASLTFYWVAEESSFSESVKSTELKTCSGDTLGIVSQPFAESIRLEGIISSEFVI